jgi:hypothetical protein
MHGSPLMGRPEITVPNLAFVYGGEAEQLCRECQLPCKFDETSVDCFRRFFLQGYLQCTYFVYGYCFLQDAAGCVFDNGGVHDTYWMNSLNQYFHNVKDVSLRDPDFIKHVDQLKELIEQQINGCQVSLCRYVEEHYNRVMETGGGMSEEMMDRLDEAYMALLSGTNRKK